MLIDLTKKVAAAQEGRRVAEADAAELVAEILETKDELQAVNSKLAAQCQALANQSNRDLTALSEKQDASSAAREAAFKKEKSDPKLGSGTHFGPQIVTFWLHFVGYLSVTLHG